jgi:FKBP-type peptidyl-prolyl cis-trans isomerase
MRKPKIIFGIVLFVGVALASRSSAAQTATTGTSAKPPASQGTGTSAKPPAAKPPAAKPASTSTANQPVLSLKDQKEKNSYALGMNIVHTMQTEEIDLDTNAFVQGAKDALAGGKTLLSPEEMTAILADLQIQINTKLAERMKIVGDANRSLGTTFLAENKTKDGVVTLPSGLQYKIIVAGSGPKPTLADTVICNYRGTLLNGTEFDSSYKRGQPATFPLSRVIKGWTEALQLMPVGSKWQLFIPADLAYGDHPPPNSTLLPGSTLIFEVELISIQGK